MLFITAFILVFIIAVLVVPFMNTNLKGNVAVAAVCIMAVISCVALYPALTGKPFEYTFNGSYITGKIPLRVDALSAWFIFTINFTFVTGALYGREYLQEYNAHSATLSLHWIAYLLVFTALSAICSLQNSLAVLIAWELMTVGSFILIIFEHQEKKTITAGINFLIQSHVCVLFLMLGFIWVATHMGSFDFNGIRQFAFGAKTFTTVALFLCFFIGFAIKAGFVPFHTWLPHAHPAAPSHVSGVLSGVIIKIGIYGILRMILLIKTDYMIIGYIILFFSLVSAVYGVMLAIVQHNLKRLLAYHSIENIGIIGIGMGLGCIGISTGNAALQMFGFAGALLHTLNHSLFKSVLFYGAGNVYQSVHTMDIEKLGGLVKAMPQTTLVFLVSSLAICGLPPFNGFISEFLIYNSMLSGLKSPDIRFLVTIATSLFGLALVGGLALLCFTKALGVVFLGNPRTTLHQPKEASFGKLFPMYAATLLIIAIGVFPGVFMNLLFTPANLFSVNMNNTATVLTGYSGKLAALGYALLLFFALTAVVFFIRRKKTISEPQPVRPTWGCGYVGKDVQLQYTASSFVRTYRKLTESVLSIHKKKIPITTVFPSTGMQETHAYDKVEEWLIDYPLRVFKRFLNRFTFLQNGNAQLYVFYGMAFIFLVLIIPVIYHSIKIFIQFINQL
jgi:hydrogenase-4 component B